MRKELVNSFLAGAESLSKISIDEETQVAYLFIDPISLGVTSAGVNSFVEGAVGNLPVSGKEKHEYFIHAEMNAIFLAVKNKVSLKNKIAFGTLSPCRDCIRALWQCGVKEIYFKNKYREYEHQISIPEIKIVSKEFENYIYWKLLPRA